MVLCGVTFVLKFANGISVPAKQMHACWFSCLVGYLGYLFHA